MEAAIKLMRTPKACYFYDANKNSIIEISAAEHAFLQGAGKIDEASLDGFAHLKELYGQGSVSYTHLSCSRRAPDARRRRSSRQTIH